MNALIYTIKKIIFYIFVTVLLYANKVLIHMIPFKTLIRFYSNASDNTSEYSVIENQVRFIRHSIQTVCNRVILKPVCFEQSLTVLLLARFFHFPSSVYFGIRKSENGNMLAHAWSRMGNYWVTGYEQKESFTVVYQVHYIPKKLVGRK